MTLCALRFEQNCGIGVSVVVPGTISTQIGANALLPDGSTSGEADSLSQNAYSPEAAAAQVLDGLASGVREIWVAEGAELGALNLRVGNPEMLFDMAAQLVASRVDGGSR